jgi:hypothetical protein
MKKIITTTFIVLFFQNNLLAQFVFADYDFDNSIQHIPAEFSTENEIYLQKNIKIHILNMPEGGVAQYSLIHEKVQLNSNEAIERNNRVYIPFRDAEKILVNKLRVILKNGNVILLNEKDIKEVILF